MESEQHMWLECENNGQALTGKQQDSFGGKPLLEHDPGGLDPPDLVPPQPYEGVTTPCFPVGDG